MICDHSWPSGIKPMANYSSLGYYILFLVLVRYFIARTEGLGYTSSIAASYGTQGRLCAIEASGEQVVLCWGKNSSRTVQATSTEVSFVVITGGENFLCGLSIGDYQAYCWVGNWTTMNTVPDQFKNTSYQTIAAGERHVCATRSLEEGARPGGIDCWGGNSNGETEPPNGLLLSSLVAGRKFTCGLDESYHAHCWGTYEYNILNQIPWEEFLSLSAGTNHVCGILRSSQKAKCWGDNGFGQANAPNNVSFTVISAGLYHSCGIRADTHEVICWGAEQFIGTGFRSGTQFLALTSAPNMTCGIREDNLLAMCWGNGIEYTPPLELFSPGICGSRDCQSGEFNFNASAIMNLPATTVGPICRDPSQKICVPCANSCPAGMFLSRACADDVDRMCTDCAFCQSESCLEACGGLSPPISSPQQQLVAKNTRPKKFGGAATIVGAAVTGGFVVAVLGALMFCLVYRKRLRYHFRGCASREKLSESGAITPASSNTGSNGGGRRYGNNAHDIVRMQAFCLAELRDATNGFKEFNELGRGSYGFVYKALLQDGRQVAVKRANATRRIQSNSRDFEAELEVLCKAHHAHLVNLLGYCEEMGERLLVYEFMPHGTLHDHLHGGLAKLSWNLRLKVATQAARGIEYLHKDASPKIIHRDIKSSNVLLDGEWGARVADFGLALPEKEKAPPRSLKPSDVAYVAPEYLISQVYSEKSDVYSFGVVLLEILTGRKAYDKEYIPANLVEWATPFLRQGKTTQILDRSLDLPRNVEPLTRMGEIIELCVRFSPEERPSMSDIASWLDLVGRGSSL
ncbi:hypothetical protein R1flu_010180 [Riccia fluitans]|uniref:non-specific serine/threonine protein kinase n=1 Tax=Riccia fluitans TaxID=41844 RepID=A0ABD1Z4C8_9MARC